MPPKGTSASTHSPTCDALRLLTGWNGITTWMVVTVVVVMVVMVVTVVVVMVVTVVVVMVVAVVVMPMVMVVVMVSTDHHYSYKTKCEGVNSIRL